MKRHEKLGKYKGLFFELPFRNKQLLIIYQMGKVGSSSIRDSLLDHPKYIAFHLHWFFPWKDLDTRSLPENNDTKAAIRIERKHAQDDFASYSTIKRVKTYINNTFFRKALYRKLANNNEPVKIISLVRDPISVNISMFFQCYDQYGCNDLALEDENNSIDDILNDFYTNYIFSWPITWFDKEFYPNTGIDIYAHDFPKDEKFTTLNVDNTSYLIMRTDLADDKKEAVISEFLGIDFKLSPSNVSATKIYAEKYKQFKQLVNFPPSALEMLLSAKYTKHFFTEQEITDLRKTHTP